MLCTCTWLLRAAIRRNTESPNDINFTVRRQQHVNICKMLLSVRKSQQPQAHVCKHHLRKKNTFRNFPRHQPTPPSEFMNKTKHASSSSVFFSRIRNIELASYAIRISRLLNIIRHAKSSEIHNLWHSR